MRLWLGPDHRGLIPGSLLAGAILLLLADTARTVAAPAEIPVGLLTSLLGAPRFLWLVFRQENSDMVNEYSAEGLSLHLGKRQIIDNVSVALRGGEMTALIGPNGAGNPLCCAC